MWDVRGQSDRRPWTALEHLTDDLHYFLFLTKLRGRPVGHHLHNAPQTPHGRTTDYPQTLTAFFDMIIPLALNQIALGVCSRGVISCQSCEVLIELHGESVSRQ